MITIDPHLNPILALPLDADVVYLATIWDIHLKAYLCLTCLDNLTTRIDSGTRCHICYLAI
jgi:hypothetical protein